LPVGSLGFRFSNLRAKRNAVPSPGTCRSAPEIRKKGCKKWETGHTAVLVAVTADVPTVEFGNDAFLRLRRKGTRKGTRLLLGGGASTFIIRRARSLAKYSSQLDRGVRKAT